MAGSAAPKRKSIMPAEPQIHKEPLKQHSVVPRRVSVSKAEILSFLIGSVILMAMTIEVIASQVNYTRAQYTLQNINQKITAVHNQNINTKQEISTLSSRDRLLELAKKYGLSMNDSNIRNVSK
ncbi:cell division protein FtsL [Liquorilactobacillus sicerae]|uniref:cell division protein FtsL n=1 Tax=Liquorilactobacillus sicerae TaxID=1416943 RepID=UPI00248193C1|nr:cell division protein FtsL [Liquorilactobacillus sicerae]